MNQIIPTVEERQIEPSGTAEEELSLEYLIRNHIRDIDELKKDLKAHREMFVDSFNNNPTYREHNDKVKEATRARNSVKQQIANQPSVAQLDQKVKDLRFDIKEKEDTLSALLLDYIGKTGATQLELFDGQEFEIVETARVVKKRSR